MKNYLLFGALDTKCLQAAGLNESAINPLVRQAIINDKMFKIYRMLDGLNDPFYNRSGVLTVATDQEYLKGSDLGGVVTAVDATLHTIARSSGLFTAGSVLSLTAYDKATDALSQFIAVVVTGGATATYAVISGTEFNWPPMAPVELFVAVLKTLSVLSIDLSTYYIKDVTKVWDNGGVAGDVRVFDPIVDPVIFQYLPGDFWHKTRVAWHFRGDVLQLDVGVNATALGVVQVEYRGKPALFTDTTIGNEIDIPPEDNQILSDEVTAEFLSQKKLALPPELAAKIGRYKEMYDAAEADKIKQLKVAAGVS
jgi:hypothetical protein